MNYELAEALREAGFPYRWRTWDGELVDKASWFPTLADLIEACAPHLYSLRRGYLQFGRGQGYPLWVAEGSGGVMVEGVTPEEAVARFYMHMAKVAR